MNSLVQTVCLRCPMRFIVAKSVSRLAFCPPAALATLSTFTGDKTGSNVATAILEHSGNTKLLAVATDVVPVVTAPTNTTDLQSESAIKSQGTISPTVEKCAGRRKKLSADPGERYTANVFLTPERAYREYLLATSDLAGLWKTKRRSPFDGRPDIVVYLRVDIEKRAVDVWGSLAKIEEEKKRRRTEKTENSDVTLALLTAMRSYSSNMDSSISDQQDFQKLIQAEQEKQDQNTKTRWVRSSQLENTVMSESEKAARRQLKGSGHVVWAAIAVNAANFLFKVIACLHTGSSAMFAESVHSFADTLNQAILAFGLWQSKRKPDQIHPYGWYNFSYVSSLISGVGIFFIGAGLSWYHGLAALLHPEALESVSWALAVLTGSFITESASLYVGVRQIRKEARLANLSFREYVRRGYDPSVNVVLAEDCVAVFGVGVASVALILSQIYASHIPDAVGSLIIGTLLGGVASLIVYTNAVILVGKSIPGRRREMMRADLEADRIIRAVYDIKATEMGGRRVRFKAEVDIDGRELTRVYLDRIDIDVLMLELQKASKTTDDLEAFMVRHGEAIVDLIGAEIDRVEQNLKKKYPEVRHVDLEVL